VEAFRANLIVYISRARPALEEVSGEVMRTRLWIENDQRTHWEEQLRQRRRQLEEAQEALFSARLSSLGHETSLNHMMVHRAKRALDESELKLRVLKKWRRDFDGRVQPMVKQMEKLHTVLCQDMVHAVAFLTQTLSILAAYAEKSPAAAEHRGEVGSAPFAATPTEQEK